MRLLATPGGGVAEHPLYARFTTMRRHWSWSLAITLTALGLAACGSDSTIVPLPEEESGVLMATDIMIVSGDDQEAEVATVLENPLTVQVLDNAGQPVAGALVTWTFTNGRGRANGQDAGTLATSRTGSDGTASIEWQLSTTAGQQFANAQIVPPAATTSSSVVSSDPAARGGERTRKNFRARGQPAQAVVLAVTPNQATLPEGESLQYDADLQDQYGNVADSLPTVIWGTSDPGVLQVDAAGTATGMTSGQAWVSATYSELEGQANVEVVTAEDTVPTPNQAPSVAINGPDDGASASVGASIVFSGSASDADGTVVSRLWAFGDGTTSTQAQPSHTYASAGTYTVTLTATDDDGESSAASITLTVVEPTADPLPPQASITSPSSNVTITAGESVTFAGSSSDPDGTVTAHLWDFGDGTYSNAENAGSHTFTTAGTFVVTYQVMDNDGLVSNAPQRTITVEADTQDPPPPPSDPSAIDWWADWRHATGSSQAALTDGGKFNGELCGFYRSSHGAVVSAAGRGFPSDMSNVFRATLSDVAMCYMVTVQDQWVGPDVGEYQYHRFYYRLEAPAGFNPGNQHFFHNGTTGADYETWWQLDAGQSVTQSGQYLMTLVLNVNDAGATEEWAQVRLQTSTTYRIEYRQHRVNASQINNAVRIYDESGALLFDSGDFIMAGASGNTLENHPVNVQDARSHFQRLELGYNGSGVIPNIGDRYGYFGGVAVKVSADSNDWIGAYTPTGG